MWRQFLTLDMVWACCCLSIILARRLYHTIGISFIYNLDLVLLQNT